MSGCRLATRALKRAGRSRQCKEQAVPEDPRQRLGRDVRRGRRGVRADAAGLSAEAFRRPGGADRSVLEIGPGTGQATRELPRLCSLVVRRQVETRSAGRGAISARDHAWSLAGSWPGPQKRVRQGSPRGWSFRRLLRRSGTWRRWATPRCPTCRRAPISAGNVPGGRCLTARGEQPIDTPRRR